MQHLHYFSSATQEYLKSLGVTCATCGTSEPGDDGWWEVGYLPTCGRCTRIAEEVAEAGGEPLVLGQVLTYDQLISLHAWKQAGINIH